VGIINERCLWQKKRVDYYAAVEKIEGNNPKILSGTASRGFAENTCSRKLKQEHLSA